jgi:tetratricopeptide (TPR) repeat protein
MCHSGGKPSNRNVVNKGVLVNRLVLLCCLLTWSSWAQHHAETVNQRTAVLLKGMGPYHHPIATENPEAQRFFDQGLVLLYAFNREEAALSFGRAAELDTKSPMPRWGVAMALGPHVNMDFDLDADRKASCAAAAQARSLVNSAPTHERELVEALWSRCSDLTIDSNKLDAAYTESMRRLAQRYPDDPDVVTLFGESLMIPHRWQWWSKEGVPAEGTEEAVQALQTVLRRHPDHPGANHLFLHAVEMSPNPERAIPSAQQLMGIVPGAGHLVHMAGHIWRLTGDYYLTAETNERAAEVDEDYFKTVGVPRGPYPYSYYSHNLHFILYARAAQGRYADASRAAERLAAQVMPGFDAMPDMVEYYLPNRYFVPLRFGRWGDVLAAPAPAPKLTTTTAFWRWSRAMALAGQGRNAEAASEQQAFLEARKDVRTGAMAMFNSVDTLLQLAATILDARLQPDETKSLALWRKAVEQQDALEYDEPAPWFYPVRESLGARLLRVGQAAEAESVFRADLERNRRDGRALFGLLESLKAQHKEAEGYWVSREFEAAWRRADVTLQIASF